MQLLIGLLAVVLGSVDGASSERTAVDEAARHLHVKSARIMDWPGSGPVRVRSPEEIRRGPAAPFRFGPEEEIYCDFRPRLNRGGNPKFRCYLMNGPKDKGGLYYDQFANLQPRVDEVDPKQGILMERNEDGVLVPLTFRQGLKSVTLRPFEIKVKYRRLKRPDRVGERDMYTEVAATRLLWALYYPVDRMYRVKSVQCYRCPQNPYRFHTTRRHNQFVTFTEAAVELKYRADEVKPAEPLYDGGWSWEELHRLRHAPGAEGFTAEQRRRVDGLVVLMGLVRHTSSLPSQNRLVCTSNRVQRVGQYMKFCPDTTILVHDLGATFGKSDAESLRTWREHRVWTEPESCRSIAFKTGEGRRQHFEISRAGQLFILDLLDQLSDDHLRAIFESAKFERYDRSLVPRIMTPEAGERIIEQWIDAFKDKVEEIRSVRCADR